ncbi:MAG: hypothetical protein ABSB41_08195 [Anaerolineales bacterium]|jgi:hypothetical protein
MQTDPVSKTRASWPQWADFLRQHGLEDLAAWALEAVGPLAILGAQALYLGEPLLRPALSDTQLAALAGLLEDRDELQDFTAFLREKGPP